MNDEDFRDFEKAGKLAFAALNFGCDLIKPGVTILGVCEKIEDYILKKGKMGFPVNVSINSDAAHDTASFDDKRVFKKGDVVKLDVGASVNGAIGDCAKTVEVGTNNHTKLLSACKTSLERVQNILKPGIQIWEIGEVIEKTAKEFGYNPIVNLGGHSIQKNTIHAGVSIPNYNNKSNITLDEGMVFAIEPFMTNGCGYVINGQKNEIAALIKNVPQRDPLGKKILNHIIQEYGTRPFSKRWIIEKFSQRAMLSLKFLEKTKAIKSYSILSEKEKGIVAQFEKTFCIRNEKIIVLTQ